MRIPPRRVLLIVALVGLAAGVYGCRQTGTFLVVEGWTDHPKTLRSEDRKLLGSTAVGEHAFVEEITHDYVMDHCVIHGSVNKVVDQILALREEIGDFGELVYAGMDWVEPALNKRSMQLMAEEVMPRVNAAIGKSAAAA